MSESFRCATCGKEISKPYKIDKAGNAYCSAACYKLRLTHLKKYRTPSQARWRHINKDFCRCGNPVVVIDDTRGIREMLKRKNGKPKKKQHKILELYQQIEELQEKSFENLDYLERLQSNCFALQAKIEYLEKCLSEK